MTDAAQTWLLSCGHEVPLLEHEEPDDRPRREKMRNVTGSAAA